MLLEEPYDPFVGEAEPLERLFMYWRSVAVHEEGKRKVKQLRPEYLAFMLMDRGWIRQRTCQRQEAGHGMDECHACIHKTDRHASPLSSVRDSRSYKEVKGELPALAPPKLVLV